MNERRVCLIDLNPPSGHGALLREIIQSCRVPKILLEEIFLKHHEPALSNHSVRSMLSPSPPELIFLVAAKQSLTRVQAVITPFQEAGSLVVAVLDDVPEDIVPLIKLGIAEMMLTPLRKEDVLSLLSRLLQQKNSRESLLGNCRERIALKRMIGETPAFSDEIAKIIPLARCDVSVLITGETGTGKELCARAIHYLGSRLDKPFVPMNCGALPFDLLENELFGHEKGAFTSASKSYAGMIQEAEGGTLFMDEVDSLPLHAQSKLLRFLQDREYRQLGSTKLRHADVRVIAASNVDLRSRVTEGKFRSDLYYRLNIISLDLPPLRERKADIPLLANYFLKKYAAQHNSPAGSFSQDALAKLLDYDWPGNIRELENMIHRAVVFSHQAVIEEHYIGVPRIEPHRNNLSFKAAKARAVAQFEKNYILQSLSIHGGNISKAAKSAQKHRRAFWELIRKYNISVQEYRSLTGC